MNTDDMLLISILSLLMLIMIYDILKTNAQASISKTQNVSEMIKIRKRFRNKVAIFSLFSPMVKNYIKMRDPIYLKTKEDLKYEFFIMYFRGFSTDIYGNKRLKDYKSKGFNEVSMYNALIRHCAEKVIAIGNPQELFSPQGCERFYCELETWQNDVQYVIEKSIANVILLHNSPNCIYEIEQCMRYKSKTYCIVTDLNVYDNLVSLFENEQIQLPQITHTNPFFFRLDRPEDVVLYNEKVFAERIKSDIVQDENNEYRDYVIGYSKVAINKEKRRIVMIGIIIILILGLMALNDYAL